MKKQTAVEWLTDQLAIDGGTMRDKALAMEKEQIMEAMSIGYHQAFEKQYETTEQYYNETYGGDK